MKRAKVFVDQVFAGILEEVERGKMYRFVYTDDYQGEPVSLLMPVEKKFFEYTVFPPFFDGLLPEGVQLEALLKIGKIDANDFFRQLIKVGHDLVGNVTVEVME